MHLRVLIGLCFYPTCVLQKSQDILLSSVSWTTTMPQNYPEYVIFGTYIIFNVLVFEYREGTCDGGGDGLIICHYTPICGYATLEVLS